MIDTKKFYINGAWVAPLAATDLDVIDPSTEQVCATISIGGAADTDAAVAAANAAVAERNSAVAAANTEHDAAVAERNAIVNSTIWKLFKPYRAILKLIKRR